MHRLLLNLPHVGAHVELNASLTYVSISASSQEAIPCSILEDAKRYPPRHCMVSALLCRADGENHFSIWQKRSLKPFQNVLYNVLCML